MSGSVPRPPVVLLAVALVAASISCGTPAPADGPSVLLVVVDTLRPDHMGAYGYDSHPTTPEVDARLDGAAIFDRAFATSPWTLPSMGSIYTGQIPTRHAAGVQVRSAGQLPARDELDGLIHHADSLFFGLDETLPTLAEILRERGYETGAVVNNPFLDPSFGVDRGFEHYDFSPAEGESSPRTADGAVDAAIAWLDGRQDPERPFFLLLHLFDPHMPYAAPAPWGGRFADGVSDRYETPLENFFFLREEIRKRTDMADEARAFQLALYDEEIAFVDAQLGRLFGHLEDGGAWDETMVVMTSDHGEEFHEHGGFEHGRKLFDEVLRIPLLVWGPGVEPGRRDVPVSLVDLLPTLVESAGTSVPDVAGRSLLGVLAGGGPPAERLIYAERPLYGEEKKAVLDWPLKAIAYYETNEQQLFDLAADPGEQVDLTAGREDDVLELMARLQETMWEADSNSRENQVTLDPETVERLRALGYLR